MRHPYVRGSNPRRPLAHRSPERHPPPAGDGSSGARPPAGRPEGPVGGRGCFGYRSAGRRLPAGRHRHARVCQRPSLRRPLRPAPHPPLSPPPRPLLLSSSSISAPFVSLSLSYLSSHLLPSPFSSFSLSSFSFSF